MSALDDHVCECQHALRVHPASGPCRTCRCPGFVEAACYSRMRHFGRRA